MERLLCYLTPKSFVIEILISTEIVSKIKTKMRIQIYKYKWYALEMIAISLKAWNEVPLTLIGWGGSNLPTLFSDGYFSMRKGVWRSQNSWLFLIHYELLENPKKWIFCSDFRLSRMCGRNQPSPHSSNIQKPPTIWVYVFKLVSYKPIMKSLLTFIIWQTPTPIFFNMLIWGEIS